MRPWRCVRRRGAGAAPQAARPDRGTPHRPRTLGHVSEGHVTPVAAVPDRRGGVGHCCPRTTRRATSGHLGGDPRDAPRRTCCSSSTMARRTDGDLADSSPPPIPGSASATGPPSRAWVAPISTGSASPSPAAPRRWSRWTRTGRTTRGAARLIAPVAWPRRSRHRLALRDRRRRDGSGDRPRVVSRGGQHVRADRPRPQPHDLTGGFKAWRATTLGSIPFDGVHAGGYVFQIEMTYRASRLGARIREVPIIFRDRRVGQSKMSRRIIGEALIVVLTLRIDELRGRARPSAALAWQGRAARWRLAPAGAVEPPLRPASASSSTPDRSRSRSVRRPPPSTSTSSSRRTTPTRSPASRSPSLPSRGPRRSDRALADLDVVGRRLLPRLVSSAGALTMTSVVLRGASIGAGWRAERSGAAGAVYHAASGALPIGSGIPVVAVCSTWAPGRCRTSTSADRGAVRAAGSRPPPRGRRRRRGPGSRGRRGGPAPAP